MNKQGTNLILEASADAPIQNLQLYGKSEQFTTTGAQLIPFELGAEMTSINGVTKCIPKKDGFRIELNGTSNQTAEFDIRFVGGYKYFEEDSYDEYENLPAGTYYAKISDNRFILNVIAWRGTNITLISTSTGGSFEVQDGDKFRIFIRPSASAVDATVKAIISKQNDSVMYEPYTGGKPSPITDYPQEITSAGDDGSIEVDVGGANLFDAKTSLKTKIESGIVSVNDDGSIMLNGTFNSSNRDFSITLQPGTYYLSCDYGNVFHILAPTDSLWNRSISVDAEQKFSCYISSGVYNNKVIRAMINKGSTALPWEPYKQPQTLTVQTPNGLPGIPVTSGGNYIDSDGQQWICDEVDFKRGKYVQRVTPITLAGSHLQQAFSSEQYGTYVNTNRGGLLRYPSQKLVMSDQYIGVAFDDRTTLVDGFRTYIDNTGKMVIRLPVGDNRSLEEIKVAVDEQKPHFLCALAAPIETDLSEEQMQQFLALRSYYPTTVVTNDEDVWMRVQYLSNDDLPDGPYSEPRSEIGQYYRALSGYTREYPESTCRETALIKCILDGTLEPPFTEPGCATEAYLLDLINNTTTMVEWTPRNDTEKFLAIMIGVTVNDYPSTDCERSFWMARCVEAQLMREAIRNGRI